MSNLITTSGMNAMKEKLNAKQNRLKELQKEKAYAYEASGDGWHDNPGWTQLGQQEEMMAKEIALLQQQIGKLKVIANNEVSLDRIQVGVKVSFEQVSCRNNISKTYCFTIGAEGEADPSKKMISITSPLGKSLSGMKKSDSKVISLPLGEFEIRILAIERPE